MSLLVTGLVWKHANVGKSTLLVLLAMADIADDDGGEIWPSAATLAAKARCDVRQVTRATDLLQSIGFIKLDRRHSGHAGNYKSWQINIAKIIESCPDGLYGSKAENGGKQASDILSGGKSSDLPTRHFRQGHRTFLAPASDISVRHIDNSPRTVLEQSSARAPVPVDKPGDARALWKAIEARLGNVKANSFCAKAIPAFVDGQLVVTFPNLFRAERAQSIVGEIEAAAGVPVVVRVAA